MAWPPEAHQQARGPLGDEVERIAQVQAGNGAAGTLDDAAFAGREGEHRAVQPVLDARGEDADDALVPALVEQRDAGGAVVDGHRFEQMQGLLLHVGLDFTAFAVEIVELLGDGQGAGRVVGDQAFDAQAHVGQAAGGVEARAEQEAEVEGGGAFGSRPAALNRAAMPAFIWPRACASGPWLTRMRLLRSSLTTSATVPSATRSSRWRIRFRALGVETSRVAQFGAQGEHDVEHHADAGDALDGKPQPGWLGLTMHSAAGSVSPGRWWSVISVAMPCCWRGRRLPGWRCRCRR